MDVRFLLTLTIFVQRGQETVLFLMLALNRLMPCTFALVMYVLCLATGRETWFEYEPFCTPEVNHKFRWERLEPFENGSSPWMLDLIAPRIGSPCIYWKEQGKVVWQNLKDVSVFLGFDVIWYETSPSLTQLTLILWVLLNLPSCKHRECLSYVRVEQVMCQKKNKRKGEGLSTYEQTKKKRKKRIY